MAESSLSTDYSRFDDIQDSDSETEDNTSSNSSSSTDAETVVQKLVRAVSSKDTGNFAFQRQEWADARAAYDEGVKILEPHKNATPPAVTDVQKDEIQKLLCTLHCNRAMVLLKVEEWSEAAKAGTAALSIDASNTKALFRRAMAYSRNGMLEESKADLMQLLNLDPANAAAKKELAGVQKKLQAHRQKQKECFAGLFERGGGVYEDKEKERRRKERQLEEQKLKEEDDWRRDNIRRRDLGQSEQTFEDWKTEKQEAAKAAEAAAKKKRDEERQKKVSSPPLKKRSVPKVEQEQGTAEDEEYDEEEQRIISETKQKGYCYFRRQQTDEEKQLLGSIAPQKVDQANDEPAVAAEMKAQEAPTPATAATATTATATAIGGSAWNFAGTFEERDMTSWAKERLKQLCSEAASSEGGLDTQNDPADLMNAIEGLDLSAGPEAGAQQLAALSEKLASMQAKVTKVKKLEGDAQIAVVRGTKRYLFDFNLQLEFAIEVHEQTGHESSGDEKPKKFKGTLNFDDISSTTAENEWECRVTWNSSPPALYRERAQQVINKLRHAVFQKVETFAAEYATL